MVQQLSNFTFIQNKTKLDIIAQTHNASRLLEAFLSPSEHTEQRFDKALIANLSFFNCAHINSRSFSKTPPCLFHSFPSAFPKLSLCLSGWFPVRRFKTQTMPVYLPSVILSLLIQHFSPIQYRTGLPRRSPLHTLPLHSLVFHMPSKALCSVPFLPLPQVLFVTSGILMGQSEALSLRISLWLIFISPLSLRFITSAAYTSRCFVLFFTLCNC